MVATDVEGDGIEALALEIGGIAFRSDLGQPRDATALVAHVEQRVGPIDLVCWNTSVADPGGLELPDEAWQDSLNSSLIAYLGLTRLVVPDMLRRGQGYLVSIAAWDAWRTLSGFPGTVAVAGDAVAALTRWLGTTYGARGLRSLAVVPDSSHPAPLPGQHVERQVTPDRVAELMLAQLQHSADSTNHSPGLATEPTPP